MESNGKAVGLWIRVSTEDQARGESPEHHEKRARLYAEAKGWTVITVYHLEAVSGKLVLDHPETRRMLSDIKDGVIQGLIFSKLARLARNTKELLEFSDLFRKHNADLISLQESIDTSSPAGRLFYTVIAALAQFEREEIAERVAVSVPIRASLAKPLGGQGSYGYKWEGKNFLVDEKEAPVRKLIYEVFSKCKRKKTTANTINEMGHRTRNGSKFSSTTIGRLLRDTTAKGIRLANHTKSLGDGKKWIKKPENEWVMTTCPAIVSEELWNECNQILDAQESQNKRVGPKVTHLLAGFIYCTCGKKMYVFHEKSLKYVCKNCKIRIPEKDIEEIYHNQLKSFLLTDSDVENYLKQSDEMIRSREILLKTMKKDHHEIYQKMETLIQMRMNGEIPKDSFPRHYQPLEERLKQIESMLPEIQAEIDFLKIQYSSSDTILKGAKDLYDRWPKLAFEDKRSIVETITNKIIIGKEEIQINLSYLPNTGKSAHNLRDSYLPPT